MGSRSLLQGIFPTQGSNPGLLHCRWIFYQLSHQGSSRIQEWVAYPFFSRSSLPRNRIRVSCIAGGFFTSWATGKPNLTLKVPNLKLWNFYRLFHWMWTSFKLFLFPFSFFPSFWTISLRTERVLSLFQSQNIVTTSVVLSHAFYIFPNNAHFSLRIILVPSTNNNPFALHTKFIVLRMSQKENLRQLKKKKESFQAILKWL